MPVPPWLLSVITLGFFLVAGGLAWSHSFVSIGVGSLLGLSLVASPLRERLFQLFRQEPLLTWPWVALYGLHLFSYLYTENCPQWWEEMRIKLPLPLLLPATIVTFEALPRKSQALILWSFHIALLIVGLGTSLKAVLNFSWALQEMREGRYVPMLGKISHIYYAGHLIAALLLLFVTSGPLLLRVAVGLTYLGIIHLLALRTALFALYAGLFVGLIYWMIKTRRWLTGMVILISMGSLLALLVTSWGPLQKRYEHICEDLAKYARGDLYHLTIGTRIAALKASWQVFTECPIWGVGIADNKDAVFKAEARLPYHWEPQFYLLPHHQFIEYTIGFGLVGLSIFMAFWVGALWRFRHPLWWSWLLGWILLMQVEAFLERQMGLTMFLWGTGLLWAQLRLRTL